MALELPDGWRDQLPDDIKENGALDNIKDIDQMATMIVNGRRLQTNQISIPSEDASPEKREEFLKDLQTKIPDLVYVGEGADMGNIYDRMGRPKEPTEYQLGDIPDPLKDNFATLASKAHEAGITDKQMKTLTDTIVTDYTESVNQQANQINENKLKLKTAFGEAMPDKLKSASEFAKKIGFDDNIVGAISDGVMGVENLQAFDRLMEGFDSPGPRIGDEQGQEFAHMTPEQAEMKINEIHNNKEHPYWDGSNPAHDAAVKKMVELTRAADAGKEPDENERFRDALMGRG